MIRPVRRHSIQPVLPRVHAIGPPYSGVTAALTEPLQQHVRLIPCEHAPSASTVNADDLVLVDLTGAHGTIEPRAITNLLDVAEVWLVVGRTAVDPGWVDRARHARVRVIQVGTGSDGHVCDALIAALLERYRGPTCRIDPDRILTEEPALQPLALYVSIVCAHPWLVRRPRDLADLAQIPLRTLKLDCHAVGFPRIEHFIIYVRAIAYEQLVLRGLCTRDARRLSGFSDPSNMRRHVRRALAQRALA